MKNVEQDRTLFLDMWNFDLKHPVLKHRLGMKLQEKNTPEIHCSLSKLPQKIVSYRNKGNSHNLRQPFQVVYIGHHKKSSQAFENSLTENPIGFIFKHKKPSKPKLKHP